MPTFKLYNELGISKSANKNEIKKAYRKLAMKHHPDKGGDEDKFKEISNAYEILMNDDKRQSYDRFGDDFLKDGNNSTPNFNSDIFQDIFGGGMVGDRFGNNMFNDLFGHGHGRHGRGRQQEQKRGNDVFYSIRISLKDVYNGKSTKIRIRSDFICEKCDGSGTKSGNSSNAICSPCEGKGFIVQVRMLGPGMIQQTQKTCNTCNGKGQVIQDNDKCMKCQGKKMYEQTKEIPIVLDKGVRDGSTFRVDGMGQQIPDGINGDLIIKVELSKHHTYKRSGDDIVTEHCITFLQSVIGSDVILEHVNGEKISFNTSSFGIINPNKQYLVKGKGLPKPGQSGSYGDLIVKFSIKYPSTKHSFSDQEKETLKNILN